MEEWRDVVGYEGLYMVSNCGRVKSLNYKRTGKEGLLTIRDDRNGYKFIILYKNKKPKGFNVHRLVAQAFIPNPDNLPQVNHKDECKWNNYIDNLEWCTNEYNQNYGTRNERTAEKVKGGKHPKSKKIKCITTGEIFGSVREAERKYNIDATSICRCCQGRYKTAGKMEWEYYEGDK